MRPGHRYSAALIALVTTLSAEMPMEGHQRGSLSGGISGIVVTNDAMPQPVRRAIVTLSGGELTSGRSAITNDEGRFELIGLAPGQFSLSAARAGYVTIPHGATRPDAAGTPVSIASGQLLTNVRLLLARGAVITGTVRDTNGDPLSGLTVSVEQLARAGAGPPTSQTVTNDRGAYRIFGLAPGRYIVSARLRPAGPVPYLSTGTANVNASLDAQVDRALRDLQNWGKSPASVPFASPPQPLPTLAPVYYPYAISADVAMPIVVAAGDEHAGVDITFVPATTSTITGRITTPSGQTIPPLLLRLMTLADQAVPGASGLAPNADGTFRVTNVLPGQYVLTARVSPSALGLGGTAAAAKPTSPCLSAAAEIVVMGSDVAGVIVPLRPCVRVRAHVQIDARVPTLAATANLRVRLVRRGIGAAGFTPISRPPFYAPDSAGILGFGSMGDITPGTYLFDLPDTTPGQGLWLRSAIINGQDVLDSPLVLTADTPLVVDAALTLTSHHTSLAGRLQTSTQQPAVDYTVIAFTTNRAWWGPLTRRVRTVRPATDGAFALHDLPPGEYFLAALTDIDPDGWQEPGFLDSLAAVAVRLTLNEGEEKRQDFQIAVK